MRVRFLHGVPRQYRGVASKGAQAALKVVPVETLRVRILYAPPDNMTKPSLLCIRLGSHPQQSQTRLVRVFLFSVL